MIGALFGLTLLAIQQSHVGIIEHGYLTEHPGRTDRHVLAVEQGLFTVTLGDNCEPFGSGQNVVVYIAADNRAVALLPLTFITNRTPLCEVVVEQRESREPCYQIDGVCDVAGVPVE